MQIDLLEGVRPIVQLPDHLPDHAIAAAADLVTKRKVCKRGPGCHPGYGLCVCVRFG